MNYASLATWSRGIALVVASAIAGIYGAHLFQTHGNIYFAIGAGLAVFVALAGAWHVLFHYAEHARRIPMIVAVLTSGFLLYIGAMMISGAAVTSMLGGTASLKGQQADMLPAFEQALIDAKTRIDAQEEVVNATLQAAAAMGIQAREEARTGEGPNFRGYLAAEASFERIAQDIKDELLSAIGAYEDGANALTAARSNLGNEDIVPAALADVAAAIRTMNATDVRNLVLSGGMVSVSEGGLAQVDRITEQLYRGVERMNFPTVEVPAYGSLSTEEAIFTGEANRYWARAAILEAVPLMLLVLLVLASREPLLRDRPDPVVVSDDEIRTREDNVVGIKGAAE